jgi:hypothetical protein
VFCLTGTDHTSSRERVHISTFGGKVGLRKGGDTPLRERSREPQFLKPNLGVATLPKPPCRAVFAAANRPRPHARRRYEPRVRVLPAPDIDSGQEPSVAGRIRRESAAECVGERARIGEIWRKGQIGAHWHTDSRHAHNSRGRLAFMHVRSTPCQYARTETSF